MHKADLLPIFDVSRWTSALKTKREQNIKIDFYTANLERVKPDRSI